GAEAPAPQEAGLEQKLQGARAAMEAREYERATDILESLQGAGGTRAREIEELLQQAKREAAARKDIAQAHKELAAGRPDQAGELLGKAEGTVAFARDLEAAKAKVEAARAEPGKTGGNVVPASGTAVDKASGGDGKVTAEKLFDEGTGYYKKKRYEEAAASFNRCLEVDPAFARCHMMLGSTSAKLRQPEVGAQHYRKFLELAPDDPKAPDVRRLLEQYDRSGR
ncbi:MAG TPA: tetratricopeptide repeat protein, partial [Myxococcaceae bacterium]|nr:tetratricopeptide repeat protein [Myxococcaceae bacterium]